MAQSKSPRPDGGEPLRLQAFLARAGVASRRASEQLIAQGRVFVNGESTTTPGTKVVPGVDRVEVDGIRVALPEITWLALHKPRGYVTTRDDPYGRPTVYDLLPARFHSLFHVGRLDRDSEGLLLLTNDGETANRFLHPSFGITKEYEVDAEGKLTNEELHRLEEGVELEDGVARAESVKRLHESGPGLFRLRMVMQEGKKREVRRMLDALGHPVQRLVRTRFGPIELGELPAGKWRIVAPEELANVLRRPKRRGPASAAGRGRAPSPSAPPGDAAKRGPQGGRSTPERGGSRGGPPERSAKRGKGSPAESRRRAPRQGPTSRPNRGPDES